MEFIENTRYYMWEKNCAVKWLTVLVFEILLAGLFIISPLSVIIFLAAAAALLILFTKPEYSLYILVLLIIPGRVATFTFGEVRLLIPQLLVGVVLFYWIVARLTKTRPPFTSTGINQPLLIFWAWALLSLLWSHNRIVGLEDILTLSSSVVLVFLITAFINKPKTLCIVLGIFIFMGFIDAIIAFASTYTNYVFQETWTFLKSSDLTLRFWHKHYGRSVGGRCMGFQAPHGTAVTLSFAITFCMMFFLTTWKKKKRMILMGIALFLFTITVGTLTKSMIISILSGTAYIVLHLKPIRRRLFTSLFVILMLAITAFALTRFQQGVGLTALRVVEAVKVQSDEMKSTSMGDRLKISAIGLQKLRETGGLGTGIGGFLHYTPYKHMDGSHPSILWDLGFVGIALWIWLLTAAFRLFVTAIKNSNNEYYRRMLIVYMGGYVSVLISWFFTYAYADIYLWFYLGIGFALVHLSRTVPFDPNLRLPYSGNGESIVII